MLPADELEPTTTVSSDESDDTTDATDEVEFSQAPDDDDELPPATDPDAEPVVPEPPDGVTVDDKGRWRNPDGKFASKQPTPEAAASVRAEQGSAPPTTPVVDPIVPWKANVYGKEVDLIPGARFHPDHGLLIPKEQIGLAQMLMARGTKYDEVKQARQQFAQEKATITEASRFENESLATILQQTSLNPEWIMLAATDPDSANKQLQFMLREAQLDLKEKYGSSQLAKPATAEPPQNDPGELDPYDAESGLRAWLTNDVLTLPEYHGLFSAAEQDAMVRRIMAVQPFAKHEGQWAIDTLVAQQFVDALAESPRREQARKAQEETQKVATQAAKRNDAAVPKSTAPATKSTPKPKSKTPDYAEKPWLDPSVSREDKREALRNRVLGSKT